MATAYDDILNRYKQAEAESKAGNAQREAEIRGIFQDVISRYEPGGAFERANLQQLSTQKTQDVGAGAQRMVGSGLYNTTGTAGLESAWERDVGSPARLRLEDVMTTRSSDAKMGLASFLERIQNEYPDLGPLMQSSQAAGQYSGGGGYGYSGSSGVKSMDEFGANLGGYSSNAGTGASYYGGGASSMDEWRKNIAKTQQEYLDYSNQQIALGKEKLAKSKQQAGEEVELTVEDMRGKIKANNMQQSGTTGSKAVNAMSDAQVKDKYFSIFGSGGMW